MPPRRSTRNTSKAEDKDKKKKDEESEEEEEEEEDTKKTTKGKGKGKTATKAASKAKGKGKAKKDESESEEESEEDTKKTTKGKGKAKAKAAPKGKKGAAKGKRAAAESESEEESDEDDKKVNKKVKGDDDKKDAKPQAKVITKGGAAVDKEFTVPDCHVYIDGSEVYAKTLNQTNIGANANKFYILQILQSDKNSSTFYTWNRWGRVGYDGQTALKSFRDANSAIKDFNKKLHDKTVKGDYVEVDISYDDDEDDDKKDDKKKVTKDDDKKKTTKAADPESESEEEKEEKKESVKTVKAKGGAVVDEYFDEADCLVYMDKNRVWHNTLNQSNIGNNNNKFYILQILESQKNKGTFYFWNRWGRVGVKGQNMKKKYTNVDDAIRDYEKKLNEKTVKGDYVIVDINFDDGEEEEEEEKKDAGDQEEKKSKLAPQVKDFIKLIFDLKMMNTQMKEIGYDPSRMPLGKLSKNAIQKGYEILKQLADAVKNKSGKHTLDTLSGQFYSYIPHDFKFEKMSNFVLDSDKKVKEKLDMLSALEEIQVATKLLDESNKKDGEESLVDIHYKKLNCELTPIERNSDTFKWITDYVKNTHAATHSSYGLEVLDAFTSVRAGEVERYTKDLHNKQLLWHGSRLTNYVGILSQGLRIAPPEAPVTGYMFGKGVYFADMVSKSANYCFTNYQNNIGVMLLCEVALGNPNELYYSDYYAANLPPNKHSTKGVGRSQPKASGSIKIENDEVLVPLGKGEQVPNFQGALLYNEYIVYDIKQIKIKYVLKMKFNYR